MFDLFDDLLEIFDDLLDVFTDIIDAGIDVFSSIIDFCMDHLFLMLMVGGIISFSISIVVNVDKTIDKKPETVVEYNIQHEDGMFPNNSDRY